MEISQSDIAQLTDMQLRHMVTDAANLGYSGRAAAESVLAV
jgi:hypothetical protein